MTADIINLRRARKTRDRKAHAAEAATRRADFGRSKAEKTETTARRDQDRRRIDGHKREPRGDE